MFKELNGIIHNDIDEFCVEHFKDDPRTHLGASEIGSDCDRYLWYKFRWFFDEVFPGRMYRLFERGNLEEMRMVKWLEGIGCTVITDDFSENQLYFDGTNHRVCSIEEALPTEINVSDVRAHVYYAKFLGLKIPQFVMSDCNGHFGGSMDGKVWLPERYKDFLDIDKPVILESKTKCTGAPFNKLRINGVIVENDQHFTQQSTYGYKTGITHAIYMVTNKNDDDLHEEIIELDHNLGKQSVLKANNIINDREPPPKLSASPAFWKCKGCNARHVCHENAIPNKNCRSCTYSNPIESTQWFCDKWDSVIPKEHIKDGCPEWSQLA